MIFKLDSIKKAGAKLLFQATAFVPLAAPNNGVSISPVFTSIYSSGSLPDLINAIFKVALTIGAILAVVRLAYAGFVYMGAADMWGEKSHAKTIIQDAVLGLVLLLSIYIILNQINPQILNLNVLTTLQQVQQATPATTNSSNSSGSASTPGSTSAVTSCPAGFDLIGSGAGAGNYCASIPGSGGSCPAGSTLSSDGMNTTCVLN